MKQYTFKVFRKTDTLSVLRFLSPEGELIGDRELPTEELQRLIEEVELGYRKAAPHLQELGRRLYEWLDGPTERWLEQARANAPGLAVHIDVSERLRHLPWELLYADGGFLCANPHRPFTPIRRVCDDHASFACANRPLHVLFMACSPEGVEPVLDYEAEERAILEATHGQPIELLVEESGSLQGLQERVLSVGQGHHDVFHLSGHADVKDGRPLFLMEDELGFKREASADEIARAFSGRWPRLVFLSGCKTGLAVDEGWLPSLCEAVVLAGAPAVLGWALPVGDAAATAAATTLYRELALGKRADEAVARARQKLLEDQSPYWHLLRLYASATPLDEHVTPLGTVGRERLRTREAATEFWDAGAKGEVCARNVFVGRRRPMQRCLRVLKSAQGEPDYAEGILLHGTGGLGKSSLAARLCERMPGHRRLVWSGRVDEMEFVKVVGDRLNSAEAIRILNDPGLALKQRLRLLLLGPLAEQSTLLVLDDFEHNLDLTSNGTAIVQAPALEVLTALLAAVRDTASDSRVIVTSRYTFPLSGPAHLYWEGLESMRGAELEKKAALLPTLQRMEHADKGLRERAITLAAGNPRLLERLDRVLADVMTDHDAMFSAMASKAEEFREEMLLRELLRQQSPACRRLLALLSTGGLPMERATAQAIAAGDALEPYLGRAVSVGLVESGKDPASKQPRYYVSGMVSPLVAQEISDQERVAACGRGARHFYQTLRLGTQAGSVEQLLETHRLACLGGEKDIAVEISDAVATAWVKRARYREAEALSRVTLSLGDDYRLLHNLARAEEVLGKTEDARRHYEQALAQCPGLAAVASPQVARERGAILSNLAGLLALQGQVQRALELWNQSLALKEQIGDVKGKAATLSMMARVIAQQGDVTRALELWNQSLVILE